MISVSEYESAEARPLPGCKTTGAKGTVTQMQEQVKSQHIPVNMYSTNGRLMVIAPMPGLEPENITIEVTTDGRLLLQGALRGILKEHDGKQRFLDEWHIGAYEREVMLPAAVDAVCANASYGNGVLALAFPLSEQTTPALLTLERVAPSHGQHQGNAGHPPVCVHVQTP
jgi:HSP20 family protein